MNNKFISIGKILNFHGIKGEAKVGFSKQNYDFIRDLKSVYFLKNGEYVSEEVSSVKFNNKVAIMKFKSINSIEEIMEMKNQLLYVESDTLENSLDEDEFLTKDLVGMDVVSNGEKLAVVVGLSNNGSTDLLTVRTNSQQISYIPFVKDICTEIDMQNKQIMINNIEGLLE